MNNYERRTLMKKEAIVKSALTLFGKHGFSDVSIKDIASSAKVSQVSIYNYFGSKEALVRECAQIILSDTVKLATDILASDEVFIKKIELALSLCNREINNALNNYLSTKALEDKHFIDLMIKDINLLKKDIYRSYIAWGKKEKLIRDISDETIFLFIEAINSIGLSIKEEEMKEKHDEIIQLFLYGLLGKATQ